jgi:hypothetical protein
LDFRSDRLRIGRLAAAGVSEALQQGFGWGFISLCGWAGIAVFGVTECGNVKSNLLPLAKRISA